MEYKVYTELQKMKYLHGISRRKSSEAKSHEIIRNVVFFNANIRSQLFTVIRLSKNCFASDTEFCQLLETCGLQSTQESLAEDPEKAQSCLLGIVNSPRERCIIINVMGVRAETHQTHSKAQLPILRQMGPFSILANLNRIQTTYM